MDCKIKIEIRMCIIGNESDYKEIMDDIGATLNKVYEKNKKIALAHTEISANCVLD